MGDLRFERYYEIIVAAEDTEMAVRRLSDDQVVSALAAASRDRNPYVSNILATEAMNRMMRARAVSRHIGAGIVLLDWQGRITFVNPEAEHLLLNEEADLVGTTFDERVHVHDGEPCHLFDCDSGGLPIRDARTRFRNSIGDIMPINVTVTRLGDEDDARGVVVAFSDASSRMATEAAERGEMDRIRGFDQALLQLASSSTIRKHGHLAALRELTEVAANAMAVDRVGIWFYEDNHGAIRLVDQFDRNTGEHTEGAHISQSEYPEYFAAVTAGRILRVPDLAAARHLGAISKDYASQENVGAMLDAPMRLAGGLHGIVCHENLGGPREWDVEEERFAASVADLAGAIVEVSRREVAESSARHTAGLLHAVITHAPLGIVITGRDGDHWTTNPAAEAMRPSLDRVIGIALGRLREEGPVAEQDIMIEDEAGEPRVFIASAFEIPDSPGPDEDVALMVGELPRVFESGALLGAALDATDTGVLLLDNQGREMFTNQAFMDMWQLPERARFFDMPGDERHRAAARLAADPEQCKREIQRTMDAGPGTLESSILLKDGGRITWRTDPVRVRSRIVGHVSVFRHSPPTPDDSGCGGR